VGYTIALPRSTFLAGQWKLSIFLTVAHGGVCALRCNRILWKSTVEPGPDSDYNESEAPHPKSRTCVGQFFANIRMWYRKCSHSSSTSSEVSTPSHSVPGSPMSTSVGGRDLVPFSQLITPEVVSLGFINNINIATVKKTPDTSLHSFSIDQTQSKAKSILKTRGPSHAGTTPAKLGPPSARTLPIELVPVTTIETFRNSPHRWRFLPFFWGDSSRTTAPTDSSLNLGESTEMIASSITNRPRKGDVVCFGYNSLDDRAMRRLEGRSDHRPVIGSFVIYLSSRFCNFYH